MKRVLIGVLIAAAALVGLLLWMAGGVQSPRTFEEAPVVLPIAADKTIPRPTATGTITVVSWNIAWGYGWGSEGTGKAKPKEHFDQSVKKIGEIVRALGADVVLLQEVDFDATRSHHADQARAIADEAGLGYLAIAPSWIANWVPFPYWPPSEHFGRMRSGGAVLSRFPITSNKVELLEKPGANTFFYNLFYLFRYIQRAEIALDGGELVVLNTHLEAFNPANREAQAEHAKAELASTITPLTIFGGDFNTVPPEQTKKSNYEDEPKTNHENDRTLEIVRTIPGLRDAIPPEVFKKAEPDFMTFPSHAPSRMLDHVLIGEGFEAIEARVAREAGTVSDHLPVVVKLARRTKTQR